jgi:hypothetical protein
VPGPGWNPVDGQEPIPAGYTPATFTKLVAPFRAAPTVGSDRDRKSQVRRVRIPWTATSTLEGRALMM